jgi:mono/diheme cytochrome c family protein
MQEDVLKQSNLKAETDFRDLLRKPEKLFGYSFLYFLGIAVLLGVLYTRNLSGIGGNNLTPLVGADSTAFVQDVAFATPSVLPPVDVMKAGVTSDSLVTRGRDLFKANCASCHGDAGSGDGPAGLTLNPKPRNFHSLAGWTNGPKVSQIYKTLEEGIIRNGMASYNHLAPVDRLALAHFVRRFAAVPPADTPGELQALETTYQLSRGKTTPGRIPVRLATGLVIDEHTAGAAMLDTLARRVEGETGDPGAQLLVRSTRDLRKVLTAFLVQRPGPPERAEFIAIVADDPIGLGFKPSVLRCSAAEWTQLHDYLAGLVRRTSDRGSS